MLLDERSEMGLCQVHANITTNYNHRSKIGGCVSDQSLLQLLALFLDRWENLSWVVHVQQGICGIIGSAAYIAYKHGVFQLPYYNKSKRTVRLYILREFFIGGVLAVIIDIGLPVSLLVGATGPTIMSLLIDKIIPGIGAAINAAIDAAAKQRLNHKINNNVEDNDGSDDI